MQKYLNYGYVLFAVSSIAFGVIEICTGDFNKGLLPVPGSVPGRTILLYSTGFAFVISGSGVFIKKWRYKASFFLGILFLILFIFIHLIKLVSNIYDAGEWTAAFEVLALCSGAFFMMRIFSYPDGSSTGWTTIAAKTFLVSRYTFSLALIVFAILHFKYADYIATLITAWIPAKLFLTYFIGVAFLATAVSILINIWVKLSTALLGAMFLLWVCVLHLPRSISTMNVEAEWTSLFVALAMSGASFMLCALSRREVNLE